VRHVTVSLPDDVYHPASLTAAERDTSVSALVREFLVKLGEQESDSVRGKRLQKEALATIRRFRVGDRLTRDQVHDRNALR